MKQYSIVLSLALLLGMLLGANLSNAQVDYTFSNLSIQRSTIAASGSSTTTVTVSNQGTVTANPTLIEFYLSTDTLLDATDTYLRDRPTGYLSAGASNTYSATINIPATTPPSNYYVLLVIDKDNLVAELDETNNLVWISIVVAPRPLDFEALLVELNPDVALAGSAVELSYGVRNWGRKTDSIDVGIFFSTDRFYQATDSLLTTRKLDSLDVNAFIRDTLMVDVPTGVLPGEYYFIVYADYLNTQTETHENNNIEEASFHVNTAYPDLRATASYLSIDTVSASQNVSVVDTIVNDGGTLHSSFFAGYYLSTDSLYDSSDVYLGGDYVPNFSSNGQGVATTSLTIPANTPAGDYYIISYIDYQEMVVESNEANNHTAHPLYVSPPLSDLDMSFLSTTSTAMPGDTITIRGTVQNRGVAISPNSYVNYYFSLDDSYDSGDSLIATLAVPNINPNQWHGQNFSYVVPSNLAYGRYHIIAYVDLVDTVTENSELNNEKFYPITIVGTGPADLVFRNAQANATIAAVFPDGWVRVEAEVHNIGQNSVFNTSVEYYLSSDTIHDAGDTYIGRDNVYNNLTPNSSTSVWEWINLPAVPSSGTYYILLHVDPSNFVVEADDANNVVYLPITIDSIYNSDLLVQSFYVSPDTVKIATPFTLKSTVVNNGLGIAAPSQARYYLSKDTIYDNRDHYVRSTLNTGYLLPAHTYTDSNSYHIQPNIPAGEYHLIIYADALNSVIETNEDNNITHHTSKIVVLGDSLLQVDLLVDTAYASIDSPEVQETLTVTTILQRNNPRPVNNFELAYYLSTDTILDSGDSLLANKNIVAINGTRYESMPVTIPNNLPLGRYYILCRIDNTEKIAEYLENNNIGIVPIEVVHPRPALTVSSSYLNPSTVILGNAFTAHYTIRNSNTNIGAGGHYVGYYLSTDNVYDNADVYLGEGYIDSIGINSSIRDTALITLPANTSAGSYKILFYADHRQQLEERDETNNTRVSNLTVTLTATVYASDLVPQSAAIGHSTLAPSGVTQAVVNIRNIGNDLAGGTYLGYYLSPTPNYNSGMIELANDYVSSLPPNNSSGESSIIMIPAGTAAGNYYIVFFADYLFGETEGNENNNIVARSITITGTGATLGDLIVNNPSVAQSRVAAGANLGVTCSIRNSWHNIGSSQVGYYLSSDVNLDAGDTFLGSNPIGALSANGSATVNQTFTIPISTPVGRHYILYKADYQNQVTEEEEGNNVVAMPIRVEVPAADLEVTTASLGTSSIQVGNFLNVTNRVSNTGAGAANATSLGYYLSTTPTYSSSAIQLGATYIQALGVGASQTKNYVLPIPTTLSVGNYYLLFYADHLEVETESDETNNVWSRPITLRGNTALQADLVVQQPSIGNTSLEVGTSTSVQCYVKNQGGVGAVASVTRYYLSSDTLWDNTDVVVGTSIASALASQDSVVQNTTISIPVMTTVGTYYLLYKTNYNNIVIESSDSNNVAYLPLSILPNQADIIVASTALSTNAALAGSSITASSVVQNQGNSSIAPSNLGYYLSTDTLYNSGDVYLGVSTVDTLQAGDTSHQQVTLTIPANTSTGNYYLLYYADHQQQRAELDRTNNVNYAALAITFPEPDLFLEQASANPTTITVGTTTVLNAWLKNQGQAAAGSSVVEYYLSTDSIYDGTDVSLGTTNNSGLGINDSSNVSFTATIPLTTLAGNYYILFHADAQNSQGESNENNNVEAVPVTLTFPLPDLRTTANNVQPTTVMAGNTTTVSCTIENTSVGPAPSHRLSYYLTTLPFFNSSAILLGDTTLMGLAGSTTMPLSNNVTIPANTPAGNYYILFYVDDQAAVAESNENNNRVFIPLTINPFVATFPDATVQMVSSNPSSVVAGGTIGLNSRLYNVGTATLPTSTLAYYLSPTAIYDNNTAIFIGSETMGSIPINTAFNQNSTVTIPSTVDAGNYYLLFYADAQHVVAESNELNNVTALPFTILDSLPDLRIQNPVAVQLNNTFQVSALVINDSYRAIDSTSLGFYLSTDSIYDAGDVFLGDKWVAALAMQSNSLESAVLSIPTGINDGNYYLLFAADYYHTAAELEENNNTAHTLLQVNVGITLLPTTNWLIYPNPTTQQVYVEFGKEQQEVEVKLYNSLGQLVTSFQQNTSNKIALDIIGPAGIYWLHINSQEGDFESIPIIKE